MVQEHDPYRKMLDEVKESTKPSLPGDASRKKAAQSDASGESARSDLADSESNATKGLYKNNASAKEQEEDAGGFRFTGNGSGGNKKKKGLLGGGFKGFKMSFAAVVIMVAVMAFGVFVMLGTPLFTIGHLDFNLQDALGFTKTSGILQKIATRIIQKKLAKGEMPSALAGDFAEHGINVGQITASGDFVRTNTYIADIDSLKDVATLGHYEVKPSEGELAILYDGQVVLADDFVNTVESNMKMFADYTEALDISAKFYYGNNVDAVYQEMGLSRSIFADWVDSGDTEKNKEVFEETMKEVLDNESNVVMFPYLDDSGDSASVSRGGVLIAPAPAPSQQVSPDDLYENPSTGEVVDSSSGQTIFQPSRDTTDATSDGGSDSGSSGTVDNDGSSRRISVSDNDNAAGIIESVANNVTGDYANDKAAQLLNAAISAGEPYLAANTFIGIESPIQQARIEGTGPVNELMNMLNHESTMTYKDALTGEIKTTKNSILTTGNFVAAVSGGQFSKNEALNFGRDRALVATSMTDQSIIRDTSTASDGQSKSSLLMPVSNGDPADAGTLIDALDDSVAIAMTESNYSLLTSQAGGNRIVEGGSFLSNMINSQVLGAMPSDESTVVAYNREAKVEMERLAAAERATKSPFDISSPYTFFGSIAHGFANAMIQNGSNGGVVSNAIGTMVSLTGESAQEMWGSVLADGENDADYGVTFGEYCDTVQSAANVQGDIYCTAHNTISTGYIDYDEDDFKNALNALGSNLDESGKIIENSDLDVFVEAGMGRWSTVGTKSAEVCEKMKNAGKVGVSTKIGDFFASALNLYNACGAVSDTDKAFLEDAATGAYFANSAENDNLEKVKLFSAYSTYAEVLSLLDGTVSKVTELKNRILAERPQDNSRAGRIARISGMTKHEAEIALAYADYLTFIARYNPAERYAFGVDLMPPESHEPLVEHASQVAVDLYVMWHGRTEYDDLRTRTRVA